MSAELRISNMVCNGKLPETIKRPLNAAKIIEKSLISCTLSNEEFSPIIAFSFLREGEYRSNSGKPTKKKKSVCVSVWPTSGSVNIFGVLSMEEAEKYYALVVAEIQRIIGAASDQPKPNDIQNTVRAGI